ncbi:MAG: sensor histidine kinase [Rhodospirillales bacterium]
MSETGAPPHALPALEPALSWDVFSRFPSAACVIDSQRRFVACNARWRSLLQPVGALAAPGTAFYDMMAAIVASGLVDTFGATDDAEWIATAMGGVLEGREFVVALRDGRQFQVDSASLADGGLLVTLNDVTTSMRHEMALATRVAELERVQGKLAAQRAEMAGLAARLDALRNEAERANRTKSEFLANMSHELRSPLNAVIGFAEIMKDELFGSLGSAQYREYALDIWNSGRHLLDVINDILDLSKIEAGKAELSESRFELGATITACLRLVSGRAQQAEIALRTSVAPEGVVLLADERKIKQVLINLLTNAIKFTKPGGRVRITVVGTKDALDIRIADTGIGMSPDDIPIALAAFGQVDSSLARKHEGTGLGLPLSKAMVEMHGGTLTIDSEVGIGTTVTVRLPAARIVSRGPSAAA